MADARAGTASAVAAALAVLAAIAVLAALATAAVRLGADEPPDPGPPAPTASTSGPDEPEETEGATFFPDGQVITGDRRDNANLEVPAADEGWTAQPTGTVRGIQAERPDGELETVGIDAPAEWEIQPCPEDGIDQNLPRAYAGLTAPGTDDGEPEPARRANETVTEQWAEVLELADNEVSEPEYDDVTISDGTPAREARLLTVPTSGVDVDDPCAPQAGELRFVSFDTGDYVATVVLVRDVRPDGSDLPDGLPAEVADQVLASPRLQEAP